MVTQKLVNLKRELRIMFFKFVSPLTSLKVEGKNGSFKNRWRFSRKAKSLVVIAIICVMLVSIFAFLPKQNVSKAIIPQTIDNSPSPSATPQKINNNKNNISTPIIGLPNFNPLPTDTPTPKPPGLLASAQTINSSVWQAVAANAWAYFQPGGGVDSTTGLPCSSGPVFTDWDLGAYIQAVIDAQKIGLIDTGGPWGSYARLDKVVTFLENRQLNANNYPYQFYCTNGLVDYPDSYQANETVDTVDIGRLFVALNNVRNYDSNLTSGINNFVYNVYDNRSNFAALLPSIKSDVLTSTSIYSYYCSSGFASFWPNNLPNVQSTILNNIYSAGNGNVTALGNVSLPKAAITGDPLFCSIFELNNTDPRLMTLANQVYLASAAYYNVTGHYRAFSEGPTFSGTWEWEWIVTPDGQTWILDSSNSNSIPIAYTKIALSFLAIYNTSYSLNMSIFLENILPNPTSGYWEGVDDAGNPLLSVGDLTNSLILDASLYAIQNNP